MKRLYESVLPGEGAVYRNLDCAGESSSSGVGCLDCLGHPVVEIISAPGCSDFPVTDNNLGALPTTFAADVEIDTYGYDSDFSSLESSSSSDSVFTDMWDMLSPAHKGSVMIIDCYCPGAGVTRPGLTLGRPSFPIIPTLPFFWIPTGGGGGITPEPGQSLTVREVNPVESLSPDCCESDLEYIKAEIVGEEIQLTPYLKPDLEEKYRAKDTHTTFQLRAGYPRWCCLENDCTDSSLGLSEPDHVLRWLHFNRWPGPDTHDPYASSGEAKEPLGLVPRVVDIQCDYNTGLLHVFYANDVIHDGHIADIQWDVLPPRPAASLGGSDFPPDQPPLNPELLPVNEDYQGQPVFDQGEFNNPIGELCDHNCEIAAANMGRPGEACAPQCWSDGALCQDGYFGVESSGVGLSESEATLNAFVQAMVDTAAIGCVSPSTHLCYTQHIGGQWEAVVKSCCPAGASL